jgi:hypothetical protein
LVDVARRQQHPAIEVSARSQEVAAPGKPNAVGRLVDEVERKRRQDWINDPRPAAPLEECAIEATDQEVTGGAAGHPCQRRARGARRLGHERARRAMQCDRPRAPADRPHLARAADHRS